LQWGLSGETLNWTNKQMLSFVVVIFLKLIGSKMLLCPISNNPALLAKKLTNAKKDGFAFYFFILPLKFFLFPNTKKILHAVFVLIFKTDSFSFIDGTV